MRYCAHKKWCKGRLYFFFIWQWFIPVKLKLKQLTCIYYWQMTLTPILLIIFRIYFSFTTYIRKKRPWKSLKFKLHNLNSIEWTFTCLQCTYNIAYNANGMFWSYRHLLIKWFQFEGNKMSKDLSKFCYNIYHFCI